MLAAIILASLVAADARAADSSDLGVVKAADQYIRWAKTPTAAELAGVFPRQAIGMAGSGHVLLHCRVTERGALHQCDVLSEAPSALGFAGAALALTSHFKVSVDPLAPQQLASAAVDLPFDFHDPTKPSASPPVVEPLWSQVPDPAFIVRNFPAEATRAGLTTGLGVVHGEVARDGALANCTVVREDPAGVGFGSAALAVAKAMLMNPWTRQRTPVDGAQLVVPIRLNLGPDRPSPPLGDIKIADFGAGWTKKAGTAGPFTPDRACRLGVRKALAVIDCKVALDGTLSACSLVADSPPNFGFGLAAIKMAQRHVMTTSPVRVDGKPVAGQLVRLSLSFTIPPGNCF